MNNNTLTRNPFAAPVFGGQQPVTNPVKATAPSTFNFGLGFNTQQPQSNPTQGFFNVKNATPMQNRFLATTNSELPTSKTESEESLLKIEKALSHLATATDETVIKNLNFELNYWITGIYNNTPEIKNNFNRMLQLSRKLEDTDLDKTNIKFFLKIHADSKTFLKQEDKDWLAKNLFSAAVATRNAISLFLETGVQCIVAQKFNYKNKVAIKFFLEKYSSPYEYVLGDFATKKSFTNSVFFDVSCCYICNLWNTYNPDYKHQIKTSYHTQEFTKSKINVTMAHLSKPNISLGVDINLQDLFINLNENPSHCLKKWFIKLDKIATKLNLFENTNLTLPNRINSLLKADTNSILKAISDIEVFYNTLTCFLDK